MCRWILWLSLWSCTSLPSTETPPEDSPEPPEPVEDSDIEEPSVPEDTDVVSPSEPSQMDTLTLGADTVRVERFDASDGTRRYDLFTTHAVRDGLPVGGQRSVVERPEDPRMRTGSIWFDALFAMAVEESHEASVDQIQDGAFANGSSVPCRCFETGEKWKYVWTRDTAYAVRLGLAWFDPIRSRDSLRFKLSERKTGGDLQIVQDTGSGGSWPVSTDRVVWAVGARDVIRYLPEDEATVFREEVLEALENTIAMDREHVFDPADGLYRGEQSFLDWREQSYPLWTRSVTVGIADSKALSTNVGHLVALRVAADLGEQVDHPMAPTWGFWADALSDAIRTSFWIEDEGRFGAIRGGPFDPSLVERWSLLGSSLAVLEDVLSEDEAALAVATYPHGPFGPPVQWPDLPEVPVYHNRAIWPFVTAFDALAAKKVGNDTAFASDVNSLMRGAALNLSNMENFEAETLQNWFDDGALSGPVINSRRQLWSVGGYVGAMVHGILGFEATDGGFTVAPFVPRVLRDDWLANTNTLRLENMAFRGRTLTLEVVLPMDTGARTGAYDVESVSIDGQFVNSAEITPDMWSDGSVVRVRLADPADAVSADMQLVPSGDMSLRRAPVEPSELSAEVSGSSVSLSWRSDASVPVVFEVFRDGERVAEGLTSPSWTDDAVDLDTQSPCYAVAAVDAGSGHASHHSQGTCVWGTDGRLQELGLHQLVVSSGTLRWADEHGRLHYGDWGREGDVITAYGVEVDRTGPHLLQLVYGNGSNAVNTGITAATRWIRVVDEATGAEVASTFVSLPQLGDWSVWADSTAGRVELEAGTTYRLEISNGPNMSMFQHFVPYTGGVGGGDDSYNMANVAALKILPLEGTRAALGESAIVLDGVDDVYEVGVAGDFSGDSLGAPLDDTDRVAIAWDDRYIYLSSHTSAFYDGYAPWMTYIQAWDGAPNTAPTASVGSAYDHQAVTYPAALPFEPTHQVTVRSATGDGPEGGPWSGLWAADAGGYGLRQRFEPGRDLFISGDGRTYTVRVSRASLGHPTHIRLVSHHLWGVGGNEWKNTVPSTHTPWDGGGSWVLIDLAGSPEPGAWPVLP